MRSNRVIVFFTACVLILVLSSCQDNRVIKIGLSTSFTGKLSTLGLSIKDSVQLAIEQINNNGGIKGRQLELIVKDDHNDTEITQKVDQELIDEGVVAIIGHITSELTRSVLTLMNKNNMLLISPTTSTKSVIDLDDNMISMNPPNTFEQETMVDYICNETEIRKMNIIYDESNRVFSEAWRDYFTALFLEKCGDIDKVISYNSNSEEDLYQKTLGLLEDSPDAVLIVASSLDTAMIAQQIHKLNTKVSLFSSGWAFDKPLIQEGGTAVESLIITTFTELESTKPKYLEFKEAFYDRYGRNPSYYEVVSYESILVLAEGMRQADKIDPMTVKEKIFEIGTFDGLQGEFSIDELGKTFRKANLYQVEAGEFKKIN